MRFEFEPVQNYNDVAKICTKNFFDILTINGKNWANKMFHQILRKFQNFDLI